MESDLEFDDIEKIVKYGSAVPWWKKAQLVENYHRRKQIIHGEAKAGPPDLIKGKKGWSIRDTAKALNLSVGGMWYELELVKTMKESPEILQILDRKEAIKWMLEKRKQNGITMER